MSEIKNPKCTVSEDGMHVTACDHLARECEYGNPQPRKRGIFCWQLFSRENGMRQPTRTFFGIVSTDSPKGFCFNFCPFCGTNIESPFNGENAP